jgi:hypothetical protein
VCTGVGAQRNLAERKMAGVLINQWIRKYAPRCVLVALATVVAMASSTHAATITVNSNSGATASGTPNAATTCTLVDAVQAANTNLAVNGCVAGSAGADTIVFDTTVFTGGSANIITFSTPLGGSIDALRVTESLTIDATLAAQPIGIGTLTLQRDPAANTPAFRLINAYDPADSGLSQAVSLELDSITLRNGLTTTDFTAIDADNINYSMGGGISSKGPLTLNNCNIANNATSGSRAHGGGIASWANLTVTNSNVSGNATKSDIPDDLGGSFSDGGGIEVINANNTDDANNSLAVALLTNSTISDNRTAGIGSRGGGINASFGIALTLVHSAVSGNSTAESSASGGGIAVDPDPSGTRDSTTTIELDDSIVSGNSVGQNTPASVIGGSGGGIFGGIVTLHNSIVTNNYAKGPGGGLMGNSVTIASSSISANGSGADGGGIHIAPVMCIGSCNDGSLLLTNSTVSGNSAQGNGGGIEGYALDVRNSTVSANTAKSDGLGIYLATGADGSTTSSLHLQSSIVSQNNYTALDAADIAGDNLTPASGDHNLLGRIDAATIVTTALTNGAAGNPDPLLDALADNGCAVPAGPTLFTACVQTQALKTGSPAIDTGAVDGSTPYDERGAGFPRVFGTGSDIGAFEVETGNLVVSGNGVVIANGESTPRPADFTDFGSLALGLSMSEIIVLQNTGTTPVTIRSMAVSGADAADFATATTGGFPLVMAAETSASTFLHFKPGAIGTRSAIVTVVIDASSSEYTYTFAVQGEATAATVDGVCGSDNGQTLLTAPVNLCSAGSAGAVTFISPAWSWSCTSLAGGSTAQCSANIETWTVDTTIAGDGGSVNPSTPQTIDNGATLAFTLTPAGGYSIGSTSGCGGNLSGLVYTTGPITNNCTVNITFDANPIAREQVSYDGQVIPPDDSAPSSSNGTDFGSTSTDRPATRTFTIFNAVAANATAISTVSLQAAGDLTISSIVSSNSAFAVSGGSGTLAQGASTTFNVSFNASLVGPQSATITVTSDDPSAPTYNFRVAATATAMPPPSVAPVPFLNRFVLALLTTLVTWSGLRVRRRSRSR